MFGCLFERLEIGQGPTGRFSCDWPIWESGRRKTTRIDADVCGHRNGKLATADVRIELTQREITVANVNWSAVDKPEENSQVWNQFANQTRQARAPLDLINNGSLSLVLLFV